MQLEKETSINQPRLINKSMVGTGNRDRNPILKFSNILAITKFSEFCEAVILGTNFAKEFIIGLIFHVACRELLVYAMFIRPFSVGVLWAINEPLCRQL